MSTTTKDILDFIDENDVKFIRLTFCDIFGAQKNISIMPTELESAFLNGVTFDASSVIGFNDVLQSDLLLFPNANTLTILPWRPNSGRVIRFYCDIKNTDGTPFLSDSRYILKNATEKLKEAGYVAKIGTECEFYLFHAGEDGMPTKTPLDYGSYLDTAPIDKGENIRREVCLGLEDMGLKPEASHHENGPGQNEIDFKFSEPLESADNFLNFKALVKAIANRNGLYASFMPKPLFDKSGNGLHLNISLFKDGKNIFKNGNDEHSPVAESFIAGILNRSREITAFLNPTVNSYDRLGTGKAPKYVSWSHQNRSQLIRIPYATGEKVRMELRSPDASINPYLAFALVIFAGLEGINNQTKLCTPNNANAINENDGLMSLPNTLEEAILIAAQSEFVKNVLSEEFLSKYIAIKQKEVNDFKHSIDSQKFYFDNYFLYL